MVFLIILCILIFIGGATIIFRSNGSWELEQKFLGILMLTMSIIILCAIYTDSLIKPLDVYRGNTELLIKTTIINSDTISCDSVVVLK